MSLAKVQQILAVVGAAVVGLPPLLHALRAFLALIPGDPGDAAVAKLESIAQSIASFVSKLLPSSSNPPSGS